MKRKMTWGLLCALALLMACGGALFAQRNRVLVGPESRTWMMNMDGRGARLGVRLEDVSAEKMKDLKLSGEGGAVVTEVGLKAADVDVDRKILADLAVREPATFGALVATRARPSTPPDAHAVATRAEIARLRELVRDRSAREEHGQFVAEGPRVVAAAFDHGAAIERLYLGTESELASGRRRRRSRSSRSQPAAERIGDTRTPQAVFAVVRRPHVDMDAFRARRLL